MNDTRPNMKTLELKAYVPAKDYALSKQFYQDLGFTLIWEGDGMAQFNAGSCCFLLQAFYVKELAENFMMHLLVEDVDAWWAHVEKQDIARKYGVRALPPEDRPWGIRDFVVVDPTSVLWRIGTVMEEAQ